MKYIAFALVLVSFSSFASRQLCPQGTTEILHCVGDAVIPMYPYVSICQDTEGKNGIALDAGSMSQPEMTPATATVDGQVTTYTTTETDMDGLAFVFDQASTRKTNGLLTFAIGPVDGAAKYKCKVVQ